MIDRRRGGALPQYPSEEEILALRPAVEDLFPTEEPPTPRPEERATSMLRLRRLRSLAAQ